jgi:NAD+ kinase
MSSDPPTDDVGTALTAPLPVRPKIACLASSSRRAQAALAELGDRYDFVGPAECDVIIALGGDGFLLHTMHEHIALSRPIFGMNRGTVGFLMNAYHADNLGARLAAATPIRIHPLEVMATTADKVTSRAIAFNEIAVTRQSGQSVHLRIVIDGVERIAAFVGDGIIVATAAGSTAYNLSAHGPIIPLGSNLLAVTPVSPFRPRRWKGALVSHTAHVAFDNLDPNKRPLAVTADFHELFHVVSLAVQEDTSTAVQLLFDPDHSLEDRIIAEQFLT